MKTDKFFAQGYEDALKDYLYSCTNICSDRWDWIVLTASNECQAHAYQMQIDRRIAEKRLPLGTSFCVVPDYSNKRIGSGGATLNVIRCLAEKIGIEEVYKQKILVIHSGGDSKRIPQYSVCGKIFAPIPRLLPNGYVSTIFDDLVIAAIDIPNRCGKGMMIFPSDTELLFNSRQIDLLSCDAAGLSIKAPVLEGQEHGVFLQGNRSHDHRNNDVARFLHKQSEIVLRARGAVDELNQVNIDTGCIWFSDKIIKEMYELISTKGIYDQVRFDQFVNSKVCLNLYSDFVYPLAYEGTWDEFCQETPEKGYSNELSKCREEIWKRFHKYGLALVKMMPARYIHFGMTHEMYNLWVSNINKYKYLGWNSKVITNAKTGTVINSYISEDSELADNCYIENAVITHSIVSEGTVLSNVDIDGFIIPSNVVMHALKLENGKYVCRIYGRNDNPKESYTSNFLESSLSKLISLTGVEKKAIWNGSTASIWNACIYPECDSMKEAVESALLLYDIITEKASEKDILKWKDSKKHSLASSYNKADVLAAIKRGNEISRKIMLEEFITEIENGADMSKAVAALNFKEDIATELILELKDIAAARCFPQNMRLYMACADICRKYSIESPDINYLSFENLAYSVICKTIIEATFDKYKVDFKKLHFVHESCTVDLPVRVNFCGSPSDAAPYCLEHGGTMIDGALLLNGKMPIKVTVSKIPEHEVRLGSLDQDCMGIFTNLEDIRNCKNPSDPYALHKAVLVATGLVPIQASGISMADFCDHLGAGIEMITAVNVPKGSGLGTSSIIAAAAVKALNELCGIRVTDEMIYAQVFLAEQLMTTGGGWQDQVGGLTKGIKYFTSRPGKYQKIEVDHLNISSDILEELNSRFALIFSGQRRLARNVLREEMNQCIRNDKSALDAISNIQEYCAVMRYYLLKGDITSFAKYISKQYELVKVLDKGASNSFIEYIFDICDDLLDGKSICGAGGGGFLQVILKKGVTKEMLRKRIQETFADCGVEVWDCELI